LSVVGSLEDLSFPDILQVVHLSRQSGTLILSGEGGERRVRFRNGLISDASLGARGPRLDELLVQRGLVAPAAIDPARRRREQTGETLASALIALGALSQETLDNVVREELRTIVRSLVLLQEGEFRFVVEEDRAAGLADGALKEGLPPDSILSGLPVQAAPDWPPDPPVIPSRVPRRVLLVSERSIVTLALREELQRAGFEAAACGSVTEGIARACSFAERAEPFLLLCDLILPEQAGTGWQGGIELVKAVRAAAPDVMALVVGEMRHPSVAEALKAAGATGYLTLPDLGSSPVGDVSGRVRDFCSQLGSALCLTDDLSGIDWNTGGCSIRVADPMSLLRGLIGELHAEGGDVALLVLRLASEYFERAALFAVADGKAACRGAFGAPLDARMRGAELPLDEGSILLRAITGRETCVGPIPEDAANRPLADRLGGEQAPVAAILPVVSGREVFGVLYGDNAPSGAPLADLRALEIFLSQAGLAIQNALLRQRLESLTARDGQKRARATA
jgi:CheY-like chemotaxis protein